MSNIVFCVPPSKNENYAGEIREALRLWSGQGNFVFTSSGTPPSHVLRHDIQ